MLRTLSQAGLTTLTQYALPLGAAIVVLLGILALSYWQTIHAYPNGAGGYIVASDNLGRLAGLVAAAALLIDYTLDVAVSVATGVQSATSAVPALAAWHVPLALLALALITLANLRGIRVAGTVMSAPIYLYILGTAAVVTVGLLRWLTGDLPPYTPPPAAQDVLAHPAETVGTLLLLRAFSSGAVALTGIEAISNGVPYFKPPEVRNAHRTLAGLAITFSALFLGLTFLAGVIGVVPDPTETETVHSQLTRTLIGSGPGLSRCWRRMASCRRPSRCAERGLPSATASCWSQPFPLYSSSHSAGAWLAWCRCSRWAPSRPSHCRKPAWLATGGGIASEAGTGEWRSTVSAPR
jgi:amino acid transporter